MTTALDKLERLSARTSREAWLQLQRMRHHPNFAALLAHLETITGTLIVSDVEQAAQRFLDSPDNT